MVWLTPQRLVSYSRPECGITSLWVLLRQLLLYQPKNLVHLPAATEMLEKTASVAPGLPSSDADQGTHVLRESSGTPARCQHGVPRWTYFVRSYLGQTCSDVHMDVQKCNLHRSYHDKDWMARERMSPENVSTIQIFTTRVLFALFKSTNSCRH